MRQMLARGAAAQWVWRGIDTAIFTELLLLHLSSLPASHADYNYYSG